MKVISFKTNSSDKRLIEIIVARAATMLGRDRIEISMDITGCHANGSPLDLEKLATAPDFDFLHDIWGIERHIDRSTGKLMNCFVPRCAQTHPQTHTLKKSNTAKLVSSCLRTWPR